jgi:hypothetical protein
MDLDEDKILNDPREAAIQQKMMADIKALMPEQPAPPPQAAPEGQGIPQGAPVPQAPEPDAQGFTGGGGGDNGGNAPQPEQQAGPPPQQIQ